MGITIGDVNGIGVEVILKALAYGRWSPETEFVLLGSEALVRKQAEAMGIPLSRRLRFHDVGEAVWHPGRLRVDASRLAVAAIEEGAWRSAAVGVEAAVVGLEFRQAAWGGAARVMVPWQRVRDDTIACEEEKIAWG